MFFAPASSALSTSSRTTEAGRSTTSPAAIWLISSSGSSRMTRGAVTSGRDKSISGIIVSPRASQSRRDNARPMDLLHFLLDFILHVDQHLADVQDEVE